MSQTASPFVLRILLLPFPQRPFNLILLPLPLGSHISNTRILCILYCGVLAYICNMHVCHLKFFQRRSDLLDGLHTAAMTHANALSDVNAVSDALLEHRRSYKCR